MLHPTAEDDQQRMQGKYVLRFWVNEKLVLRVNRNDIFYWIDMFWNKNEIKLNMIVVLSVRKLVDVDRTISIDLYLCKTCAVI